MTTYTAYDFKNARFATIQRGIVECRAAAHGSRDGEPDRWIVDCSRVQFSDDEMAADGWVPVQEAAPALLDSLTRAEAQSEARRINTEYWKERAEAFQQDAADERAGLLDALDTIKRLGAERDEARRLARHAREMKRDEEDQRMQAEERLTEAEARIKAVRDAHQPLDALHENTNRIRQVCTGCGTDAGNWQIWPCPTIRALDG